jgi:hypothetical protein
LWALNIIKSASSGPSKGLGFYFTFTMQITCLIFSLHTTSQRKKGK